MGANGHEWARILAPSALEMLQEVRVTAEIADSAILQAGSHRLMSNVRFIVSISSARSIRGD